MAEVGLEFDAGLGDVVGQVVAFEAQPASVPTPAFMVCRSNMIGPPAAPVKVDQPVILGVRVGAPTRLP